MSIQTLPVSIQTMVIKRPGTTIYYPQVYGLQEMHVQQYINQTIYQLVRALIQYQYQQQGTNTFADMIGTFEIKTNERNLLSLTLTNYAMADHHAHGLTLMKSLTFDIQTGENYTLQDLFKPNSNYIHVLSKHVEHQIQERDIQLLNGFSSISPDQDFYIADKTLVLYFQLYEITPYYVGLPMFPISIYTLQHIIPENGLLERMIN
ncbi:DUF3298 and DUF4163 domain-containing protein [Virgibacillus alimentarius]|uniref:DUF3298 domain-containing protein n=1 Tax=Virgibacillus alimentarius TaxID=698769 RepID=A0ABS4S7R3_9BACI|nr:MULTISPECIES: DUF3298 and DUF4163 domain-containing protein [Virgibacillus]MBP2257538.1 hypothetical protein [Virgibacillus alimentarius]HLR68890.1 DUF3298 domain-containing protein [Virgibacillus sp.]